MQKKSSVRIVMLMRNRTFKGATLAEVLIACSIFSFLLITLFAIIKFSLNNWRGVEDRSAIQAEVRKVQLNLMEDLTRSSIESVVVKDDVAYPRVLAFKTFIKNDGTATPPDGTPMVSETGMPQSQGYVIFLLLRPQIDTCEWRPENCPHKVLVRVDVTKTAGMLDMLSKDDLTPFIPADALTGNGKVSSLTSMTTYPAEAYKAAIPGGPEPNSSIERKTMVQNVYVVGKNVLVFQPVKNTNSVSVTLKALRFLEMGRGFMQATDLPDEDYLSDTTYSNGTSKSFAEKYSIQVNSEIFPMNYEIETTPPPAP